MRGHLICRNKCEFTIGPNEEGKATVGFRLSSFMGGSVRVAEPGTCPNVPVEMKSMCVALQNHVRGSQFGHYDMVSDRHALLGGHDVQYSVL